MQRTAVRMMHFVGGIRQVLPAHRPTITQNARNAICSTLSTPPHPHLKMQGIAVRMMHYAGGFQNVPPEHRATILENVTPAMKEKYPKITNAKIQGYKPHRSSKDLSDRKEVITVTYHTADGVHVATAHAHADGTFEWWPTNKAHKGK